MVSKKKQAETEAVTTENQFTKQQILQSVRYQSKRDIVSALLQEGELYTLETIEQKINDFMKGKVN